MSDDDVEAAGGSGPPRGRRVRDVPGPLRRLAPALVVIALLVLPAGMTVRTMMAGARSSPPAVTVAGDDEDAPVDIDQFLDPDLLDAVPVGAEDVAEPVRDVLSGSEVIDALDGSGIPGIARAAYDDAEAELAGADPACGLRWSLLAAIGRVESDHGRFGGARLRDDGYGTRPIRGIPLDGRPNVALIRDTDGGELDDDTTFDRAVGPMQIIPTTWRSIASDGNGDARRDPNNVFDAAQGAGRYLCSGDADLGEPGGRARAVRRYNNADEYVRVVLSLATMYETGDLDAVEAAMDETGAFEDLLDDAPAADPGPAWDPLPPPSPVPVPAPAPPPAAVGWAPAMREIVVSIITAPAPAAPTTSTTRPTTTTRSPTATSTSSSTTTTVARTSTTRPPTTRAGR